jgi:hypothetical protein
MAQSFKQNGKKTTSEVPTVLKRSEIGAMEGNSQLSRRRKIKNTLRYIRAELNDALDDNKILRAALKDSRDCIDTIMDFVMPRFPNLTYILLRICRRYHARDMRSSNLNVREAVESLREQRILYKKLIAKTKAFHQDAERILDEESRTSLRSFAAQNVSLRARILLLENRLGFRKQNT